MTVGWNRENHFMMVKWQSTRFKIFKITVCHCHILSLTLSLSHSLAHSVSHTLTLSLTLRKLMKALLPHSSTFLSYLANRFISVSIVNFVRQYLRTFSFLLLLTDSSALSLAVSVASSFESTAISIPSCSLIKIQVK